MRALLNPDRARCRVSIATPPERGRSLASPPSQLRAVLDELPFAVALYDTNAIALFVNRAGARILGYDDPERLVGQSLHEVAHARRPDGSPHPASECASDRAIRGGYALTEIVLLRAGDGAPFVGRLTIVPVRRDGLHVGAVGFLEASAATGAPPTFRAMVLDAIGEAVVATTPEGVIVEWNAAAERLFGWSAAEAIGHDAASVVALGEADDGSGLRSARRRDGTTFPAHVTSTAVRDEAGRLVATIEVCRDVTELRETARRLADGEAVARSGTWEIDVEKRTIAYSAGMCAILGRAPEVLASLPIGALPMIHADDHAAYRAAIRRAIDAGTEEKVAARVVRPDGSVTRIEGYVRALAGPSGNRTRVVGAARDVTEERRFAEEAETARRIAAEQERLSMLGTLIAGVNHEIANALTVLTISDQLVAMRASEILADYDLPEPVNAAVQALARHAEGAKRGIDELTRISRGLRTVYRTRPGERRDIAPRAPCETALLLAASRLPVKVEVEPQFADTRLVRANEGELVQVMLNLVLNAGDAMASQPRGRLVVRTFDLGEDRVAIEVEDSGPGISPEVASRLFTPFTTTKPHGSGLGLSVSRRLVESHGGTLTCESRPGSGATFRVELPAVKPERA